MRVQERDKPFLYALLILAVLLGFVVLRSFEPPLQPPPQSAAAQQAQQQGSSKSVFWNISPLRWTSDEITAVFTALAFLAVAGQWVGILRADKHFRVTERAYVKMSHISPGIKWPMTFGGANVEIVVQIKNHGGTPADVTDAVLFHWIVSPNDDLPEEPPYNLGDTDRVPEQGFLVSNDEMFISRDFPISWEDRNLIDDDEKMLIVIGYVDYRDKFGQRHRGGYARMYDPVAGADPAKNNLLIFPHRAYNYDRLRKPEGNDWPD